MKFDPEYKKQVDKFCENINMPDPDEMLNIAKARSTERNEITMTKNNKKRISRYTIIAAVSAACLTAASATAFAYTSGNLGELFGNIFHDDVTSKIIDEGHFSEIGQINEDDIFSADLVAITGDEYNAHLVFDIYVFDEEIAAKYDSLEIDAYVLDEETYDSDLEHYGTFTGKGCRDDETPNLYHVDLYGGLTLTNSEKGVACIRTIRFGSDDDIQEFDVDMEYRFDVDENTFKSTDPVFIDNIFTDYNGITYQLGTMVFNNYETMIHFEYNIADTFLAGYDTDSQEFEDALLSEFEGLLETFIINADGTEIRVDLETDDHNAYCDPDGSFLTKPYDAVGWCDMPAIDYENTENITFTINGQDFIIKENGRYQDTIYEEGTDYTFYEYSDISVNFNEADISLYTACFNDAGTEMNFRFYVPEELRSLSNEELTRAVDELWLGFIRDVTVTADGTEYSRISSDMITPIIGIDDDEYFCWASASFPGISYENTDNISITMNGVTYDLKMVVENIDEEEYILVETDDVYEAASDDENIEMTEE